MQNSSDYLPSYLQTTIIAQMVSIRRRRGSVKNIKTSTRNKKTRMSLKTDSNGYHETAMITIATMITVTT